MEDIIEFTICNNNNKLNILTHQMDNPEIILIHLHGLHSTFQFISDEPDEFYNRIKIFKKKNIVSYALEFNGHGKSDGKKAYVDNFNNLIEDVNCLVNYVTKYYDNKLPIYLLGESMGGNVCIQYSNLYEDKIKGIILLSPLFGISNLPNSTIVNGILLLSYILPTVNLKAFYSRNTVTNEKYYEILSKNKYNFSQILTLTSIRECYNATLWIKENIKNFKTPVLLFHSKYDKTTEFESSKEFFSKCNNKNNEFISYNCNKHNLLVKSDEKDFTPHLILHKILNWIN